MKKTNKLILVAAFSALIIFSITACGKDELIDDSENPYLGNTLSVKNEQVWEHTNSNRISQAYTKSTVSSSVSIVTQDNAVLGSGEIKNGILSFTVSEPGAENLLAWDDLSKIFYEWKAVTIDAAGTNGSIITLKRTDTDGNLTGLLNREKLVGTNISLGLEYIMYIYVDRDCKITGNHGEGERDDVYSWYTDNVLDLSMEKGWNALCRKEVYDRSGNDIISMEIKNIADFRWAIW